MTKQNQTITVNRLPAKTWNWLKMNETVIGMPRIDGSIAIKQSVAEAGQAEDEQLRMAQQTDWDKITTGMGEAMDQPSETDVAWDTELLTIPEHADCGEPYVYRFSYQSGQHAYNRLHIYAGAHSRAKVILLCERRDDVRHPDEGICRGGRESRTVCGADDECGSRLPA